LFGFCGLGREIALPFYNVGDFVEVVVLEVMLVGAILYSAAYSKGK